jgi:two-component system sensor histidine kinase PilS (NtrC family)
MSEKTKQKLFEPFYTTKSKGTGLGLALTHKILEGHRAQIFVESEENKGSKFVIEFKQG